MPLLTTHHDSSEETNTKENNDALFQFRDNVSRFLSFKPTCMIDDDALIATSETAIR